MKSFNRRSFLKSTALTAAAFSLPARSWSQVEGSNSDVRVAVVGCGGRGKDHIQGFAKLPGVRVTALCDIDENHTGQHAALLRAQNKNVEVFTDVRKLLESKNVDVVTMATPNHWHALAGIWAIQAGKDVYTEKPVSHNVWEGRKFVEAARHHKKIVQTGTQSRSSREGIAQAVEWVKAGNIGKIVISRGLCYKPRPSIGKVDAPQPVPAGVDYDLWCGPAEKLPLMRKRLHYDWHWVWNTGNGDLGNQGIHQMDICRWFLGEMELAPFVVSAGGRLGYIDDGETANTQIIYHGYAKAPLIFEVRGLPEKTGAKNMDKLKGASVGCVIECEGGYVVVPNYRSAIAYDKDGKELQRWQGGGDNAPHMSNFIKVVLSRKVEDLYADILEGHLSSALCHTGNISYRLGATKNPNEIKEALKDDKGMVDSFDRMAEHLGKNDVDITKDKVTLGVPLKMNGKTEKFIGNEKANALLTRNYRAPYIVPEKV
ncbi:MAG TPA: Gfo/Idh/MocA family oxidoreductase [Methylomirabilota bacterium]|nr:Gfo/Idh/MocA family oxidoreductase [Methylomirabilota bacterium]